MLGSDNSPFRIRPPRLIADSATQDAGGNLFAAGLQKGKTAARDTMTGARGFSAGASNSMYAAQQKAAGAAEGAQQRAGIEAEDQAFNTNQKFDNEMLRQGAMAFDYGQMTDANQAGFDFRFNRLANGASIANARRQAQIRLRLAMLGQGLS